MIEDDLESLFVTYEREKTAINHAWRWARRKFGKSPFPLSAVVERALRRYPDVDHIRIRREIERRISSPRYGLRQ